MMLSSLLCVVGPLLESESTLPDAGSTFYAVQLRANKIFTSKAGVSFGRLMLASATHKMFSLRAVFNRTKDLYNSRNARCRNAMLYLNLRNFSAERE